MTDCVYLGYCNHFQEPHKIMKIGKTQCLGSRRTQYNTSYPQHSFMYYMVISILIGSSINSRDLEGLFHHQFKDFNTNGNAGNEWFYWDKINDDHIKDFLKQLETNSGLKYDILTDDEIKQRIREYNRSNNYSQSPKPNNKLLFKYMWNNNIQLYQYQWECLEKAKEMFLDTNKLILNWVCGLGKTLTSLRISSYYVSNRLLIGVPSNLLLKQWITQMNRISFYKSYKLLIICSDNNVKNILNDNEPNSYLITTNPTKISKFMNDNNMYVVITMYQSSHLLNQLFIDNKITNEFEFSILDECHYLCKWNDNKSKHQNTDILHIPSQKQLGLTATMKKLKNENSIDNYDKELFGEILDSKSVLWAIENEKITDYYLLTLNMKREELEDIMEECKIEEGKEELFLSAYMSLLAMSKYKNDFTHTLIYTNTTKNAELVNYYINIILKKNIIEINKDDIYHNSLHSNSKEDSNIGEAATATDEKPKTKTKKNNVLDTELDKFKNSKYGIISCVYIFGEGFDLPKLNGVVFAENMESEIRIVQSALRGNRIDKNNPDKMSYIMIPFIDDSEIYIDSSEKKNKSFEKVRKIIERLRMEDDNIDQRIRAPKTSTNKSGGGGGERYNKKQNYEKIWSSHQK